MKNIFQFFIIPVVALILASCGEKATPVEGVAEQDLVLSFDKSVIQATGSDVVTFTIYYEGKNVTDQTDAKIYNQTTKKWMTSRSFSTDKVGKYSFQVVYMAESSEVVTINAIERPVPKVPADTEHNSTSFVHRAFFNQHTGAACSNCPFMTYLIRQTINDEVKDKVVLASLRNYSGETGFAVVTNPTGNWPYLQIDFDEGFPYNGTPESLRAKINSIASEPAKVGIAAKAEYYDDNQIIVTVAVKAAQDGRYNVGLWLMQDNYFAEQAVDAQRLSLLGGTWGKSYHYHDNSVRVAESKYLGSHVGYPLGYMKKGQIVEWTFLFNVITEGTSTITEWWEYTPVDLNDLHFAAFVTTPVQKGNNEVYKTVNAIDFPYNGEVGFEYIK